jgi:hypothetical protein
VAYWLTLLGAALQDSESPYPRLPHYRQSTQSHSG